MAKKNIKSDRNDFWEMQRRKTLIESAGASVRLSGSKITNEEVAKIIDSEKGKTECQLTCDLVDIGRVNIN